MGPSWQKHIIKIKGGDVKLIKRGVFNERAP